MSEELKQTRTSKNLIWLLRLLKWPWQLNTEKMENGVPTTPKPHLLFIGVPSIVSTSRLTTQSNIKSAFLSKMSMTLNNCNNNWTLGKLSRTQTKVLNSQDNIREDCYLPMTSTSINSGLKLSGRRSTDCWNRLLGPSNPSPNTGSSNSRSLNKRRAGDQPHGSWRSS